MWCTKMSPVLHQKISRLSPTPLTFGDRTTLIVKWYENCGIHKMGKSATPSELHIDSLMMCDLIIEMDQYG
jgi:hypothetical protein